MNKKKLAAGTPQNVARTTATLSTVSMAILMIAHAQAQTTESPAESRPPAPEATQPVDMEVFKSAQILTSGTILNNRASGELGMGREGWVVLNMMIDPKGKPYEVMVQDSSGNSALERAALNAIDQVRFAPARRGDTAIDSSFTFKFTFSANRSHGASRTFVKRYAKFSKAVADGDKATADSMLPTLYGDNLYEQAFEHYARYFYFSKWGTPADQLKELAQALAGEKNAGYLPKEAFVHALMAQFSLQARTRDYGGALSTWAILEPPGTRFVLRQ